MNRKADLTIKKYNMLSQGDSVVIGLSGGADSVALTYYLHSIKDIFNLKIYACHVNHNLRGDESLRDENFVREFCKALNIPLEVLSLDIISLSRQQKLSSELCARNERYSFFERLSQKYNAKIATAHTLSDSIETVILNMCRGTSIKGLCGIPPVRGNIIRPLIECSRSDIEEYCKSNSLSFVTDSTNLSTDYTRNKIRHNVVPELYKINSSADTAIMRMCQNLQNDNEYIENQAEIVYNQIVAENCINLDKYFTFNKSIRFRVISRFWAENGCELDSRMFDLTEEFAKKGSGKIEIGKIKFLRFANNTLSFENKVAAREFFSYKFNLQTDNITDINIFDNKHILFETENICSKKIHQKYSNNLLKNVLDYDKIVGNIVLRQKIDGDYISLAARNAGKPLKKLFNEGKIPVSKRTDIAVLADEAGVLWVEGFGCDKRACVNSNTKKIIIITVSEVVQ